MNAPPTGRMTVCKTSQTVSRYGTLSAKNSTRNMTTAAPITTSEPKAPY